MNMYKNSTRIYRNPRPELVIKYESSTTEGRCYHKTLYSVTSLKPLTEQTFKILDLAGLIGHGQGISYAFKNEHGVYENYFGKDDKPSGFDHVDCCEIANETGKILACPSTNPYSGLPDKPIKVPYYEYRVTRTVDSSD